MLSGCTGGNVTVNSMGQKLESGLVLQGQAEASFLEINQNNYKLNLKFSCHENYSLVQIRFKTSVQNSEWYELGKMACGAENSKYEYDLTSLKGFLNLGKDNLVEFRLVGEKGFSEPAEKNLVFSSYVVSSEQINFQDYFGFYNNQKINLNLNAKFSFKNNESHDPAEVYITENSSCSEGGAWQEFQTTKSWTLSKSNQSNTAFVKFRNHAEIESPCFSVSTFFDSISPVAMSISLIGFSTNLVNTTDVSLNLVATGDAYEMLISNDGLCLNGSWESIVNIKTAVPVLNLNTINFVSVKFRDQAHNESSCLALSFIHDGIPPALPTLTLISGGGANPSQITTPVLQLKNIAVGDHIFLYNDSSCSSLASSFTSTKTDEFVTPIYSADGNYPFYIVSTDLAQNTLTCSGPIFVYKLDRSPPTISGSGHPTTVSNVPSWTETISSSNIFDIFEYKYKIGLSAGTNCSDKNLGYSSWIDYANSPTTFIDASALADGSVTLCLYARDRAMNEQISPTVYSWTKNTSSLKAEFVTSTLPRIKTNVSSLNIQVGGVFITDYKYKVGVAGSTDCSLATGYSASFTPIATNITSSLSSYSSGTQIKICLIGKNSSSALEQPLPLETSYTFTRDTSPAIVTSIDMPLAGDYLIGDDIIIGINFNEDIFIDPTKSPNTLAIRLNNGGVPRNANFYRQVSTTKLEFIYKVITGDSGNFGYGSNVGLPTTGFIVDEAGNSLDSASSNVTANLSNVTVMTKNENPVLDFVIKDSDVFEESTDQMQFIARLNSIITTNLNFTFYLEISKDDGSILRSEYISDVIPAGTQEKTITISGINNATVDGLKSVAIDLRYVNHGSVGVKQIRGAIKDDETANDGPVINFAIGANSLCFLTANGSVYCLGSSSNGALGSGNTNEVKAKATKISSLVNVSSIYSNGSENYCAKKSDGSLWCWGMNTNGQLGNGTTGSQSTPIMISGVGNDPQIISFQQDDIMCTKDTVQGLKCQGNNAFSSLLGKLGIGNTTSSNISSPTSVMAQIQNAIQFVNGAVYVSGNKYSRCALVDDGDLSDGGNLYCWGNLVANGISETVNYNDPQLLSGNVYGVFNVGVGLCIYGEFDVGKPGLEVKCWGAGRLLGSYLSVLGVDPNLSNKVGLPTEILGLENTQKMLGDPFGYFACVLGDYDAVPTDYEVKCWGHNSYGQLGRGNTTSTFLPTLVAGVHLSSKDDLKNYSATVCAKKTDGSLWCWGSGFSSAPTQVQATDIQEYTMASDAVFIKNSLGGLKCYGSSCSSYLSGQGLPEKNVAEFQIGSNYKFCFIINGALKCLGGNVSRLGQGRILTLNESTRMFDATEIRNITDGGNFCFDFNQNYYQCRGANQYTLGVPSAASFTSLLGSKISTAYTELVFLNKNLFYKDSLSNVIFNYFYWGSNMLTSGFGKNFTLFSPANSGGTTLFGNASGKYSSYISSPLLSKSSDSVQPIAGAMNYGNYHQCFINTDTTVRCLANACNTGSTQGQLGNNDTSTCVTGKLVTPINGAGVLSGVTELYTAQNRSCAKTQDNSVVCWGQYIGNLASELRPLIQKMKMDTSGRIYTLDTSNRLEQSGTSDQNFIAIASSVQDFWVSAEGVCVKKMDGHYYCFPNSSTGDASIFGKFFDMLSFVIY